jgi:plastocyanin
MMKVGIRHLWTVVAGSVALSAAPLTGPVGADASEVDVPVPTGVSSGVDLQGVRFAPREITVRVGDTVTWTHRDSGLSHHVAADDGFFDSHPTCGRLHGVCMKGGDRFSYKFLRAGTYGYHCRLHRDESNGGMAGTVTVVE